MTRCVTALVEDAIARIFGGADRATESRPDTKVISVTQTVVNRALAEGFRNAPFCSAVQQAVHKCLAGPQSTDAVPTRMIDAPVPAVPVARFIRTEVEKVFLDSTKMEELFSKLAETVAEKKIKIEDEILTKRIDWARFSSPQTDISDDKKASTKTYYTAISLDESESRCYHTCCQEKRSRLHRVCRHHCIPTPRRISEHSPSLV